MDKQIELKRLIADFNVVVNRLNKADKYFNNESDRKCTDEAFEKFEPTYTSLLKQASEFANRIENFIGRPLTTYESLHGINI